MSKRLCVLVVTGVVLLGTVSANAAGRVPDHDPFLPKYIRWIVKVVKQFTTTTHEDTMSVPKS